MSSAEIDAYLAALAEPQRSTLTDLRRMIMEIVPEADEIIAYGMPAFRLHDKVVAGFAAFKNHVSYFPHSGSVLPSLKKDVKGYATSTGTLRFAPDEPLPRALVENLIAVRIDQAFDTKLRKR
ncbi:MAG: iron chaperone [Acidimicrobiales bacterium]